MGFDHCVFITIKSSIEMRLIVSNAQKMKLSPSSIALHCMSIALFLNFFSMDINNISISESYLIIDYQSSDFPIIYIQCQPCIQGLIIFQSYSMTVYLLAVYNFYCVEMPVSLYPMRVFYSSVTYYKGLYYIPILSLRIVMYIHCKLHIHAIILVDKNDTRF